MESCGPISKIDSRLQFAERLVGLRRGDIVVGRAISPKIFDHIWRISACGPKTSLEIRGSGAFALRIKGFQKLCLEIMQKEDFFSEILRELARSKNE